MQNTRRGKGKYVLLVLTLLAVVGITIGFAAFSNTLTIKSSATVTPSSDTFKVVFSSSATALEINEIVPTLTYDGLSGDAVKSEWLNASNAVINNTGNPTIGGISANMTAPGSIVEYVFYIRNEGEYDAYLNEVKFNNASNGDSTLVCTVDTDENGNPLATQSLVDATCNNIGMEVAIIYDGEPLVSFETTKYTNKVLKPGESVQVYFYVLYSSSDIELAARADGPFTVSIGDIEMVWSTVDVNAS